MVIAKVDNLYVQECFVKTTCVILTGDKDKAQPIRENQMKFLKENFKNVKFYKIVVTTEEVEIWV